MPECDRDFIRRQRLSYYEKLFPIASSPSDTVIEKPAEVTHLETQTPCEETDEAEWEPDYSTDYTEWDSQYYLDWEPQHGDLESPSVEPAPPVSAWEVPPVSPPLVEESKNEDFFTTPQFLVTFAPRIKSEGFPSSTQVVDDLESQHDYSVSSQASNEKSLHDSIRYARKRRSDDDPENSNKRRNDNDDPTNVQPQQSLTVETIATLHSALKACPTEETYEADPIGLKVELMPHQKHALAWLLWREREKPSGGLLADDMGLGKTLTMISLVLRSREIEDKRNNAAGQRDEENEDPSQWVKSKMVQGGTLVVCPASVVGQWEREIKDKCRKDLLSVLLYHGSYREVRVKRIARKDIVISTYNLVGRESGIEIAKNPLYGLKDRGPLHRIKWKRIILDEAHIVRNHKSQTSMGVNALVGKYRWCLSGTPIQNKELDLYALLKFLRCSPFDDLKVWKRWVDNKNEAGLKRLSAMMKSLMLRRTKQQLQEKGALKNLPTKSFETISVTLDPEELKIYQKVALFSSTLFMQFLKQRAEKGRGEGNMPHWEQGDPLNNQWMENKEVVEMYRKMKLKYTEIKSHHILVLLLRLRQICCHAGLIKQMLLEDDLTAAGLDDEDETLGENLFSAMEKIAAVAVKAEKDAGAFKMEPDELLGEDETNVLSPDNPVLEFSRASSKIRAVLDVLVDKVMSTEDKAVVVSQWTSMLTIIHDHLRDMGVKCEVFCGNVPVTKRMEIVDDFNSRESSFKVLLLSLTAGGVGLNLIGGNHLFLVDLHWNPQLEAQACDRIFRVGQIKPVSIYKFICADTIEERIRELQEKKITLARDVLTGAINLQAAKLTIEDLKLLFGVGLHQPGVRLHEPGF